MTDYIDSKTIKNLNLTRILVLIICYLILNQIRTFFDISSWMCLYENECEYNMDTSRNFKLQKQGNEKLS